MSENKKRGRPEGTTKNGFTTGRFSITVEEAKKLDEAYEAFKKANNLEKLSKSDFIRSLIKKGLKGLKGIK